MNNKDDNNEDKDDTKLPIQYTHNPSQEENAETLFNFSQGTRIEETLAYKRWLKDNPNAK
jgi:GrpB-like predicted nucleotidyltransferase (UPF0157 family)